MVESQPTNVVDRAQAVRGLVEAGRVTGDRKYLNAASRLFREMREDYDVALGYFESKTRLTNWEVGDIIGALNTLSRHAGDDIDQSRVQRMFVGFFEAAVNRSGLMRAVPPKEMEASPWEVARTGNDLFFGYPTIPTPDKAGGPYGRAAVGAAEIAFDEGAGRWVVSDASFDSAGAMHTSNEQIWTFGSVNGFPDVKSSAAQELAPSTGSGSDNGSGSPAAATNVDVNAAVFLPLGVLVVLMPAIVGGLLPEVQTPQA